MEKTGQYKRNNTGMLWFFLNLIVGAYFLNLGLKFIDLSKIITEPINNVIIIIGGGLIILSGIMSLRRNPAPMMYHR